MNNSKVMQPNISEETKKEMIDFFMKTSIPRILSQAKNNGKTGVKK